MRVDDLRLEQALYIRRRLRLLRTVKVFFLLTVIFGFCIVNVLGNQRFEVTIYQIQSERVQTAFRIALLSDLHN